MKGNKKCSFNKKLIAASKISLLKIKT